MAALLSFMFSEQSNLQQGLPSPFSKAKDKVLSTLCETICSLDGAAIEDDGICYEQDSFARALQSFVHLVSTHIDSLAELSPIWLRLRPMLETKTGDDSAVLQRPLNLLKVVCGQLQPSCALARHVNETFMPSLVMIACCSKDVQTRSKASEVARSLCSNHTTTALPVAIPGIVQNLQNKANDAHRLAACQLLLDVVQVVGLDLCPFVRQLLRIVMSLMADPLPSCARIANATFACLVRVAPLVKCETKELGNLRKEGYDEASVVDHLIHGRPLPPYSLPSKVQSSLDKNGIRLRKYQMEGITWLRFLQGVHLNGALCDSMGLGE